MLCPDRLPILDAVKVTVTGGAGYVGALVCKELVERDDDVRALDVVLHGQEDVVGELGELGVELIRGDVRDAGLRERALTGADAVVHLAAIVGDPACARDPELSQAVNVDASRDLVDDAARLGVERIVFASTCSNYGRMADPTVPVAEGGELRPVSLYAEQKVSVEQMLLSGRFAGSGLAPTCVRLATVYGVAPRMRFDLTVNEFTRDLWADRELEVFGERFWRPYVHVADAARSIALVLASPADQVGGDVFNVGHSDENYRKLDLVELIKGHLGRGQVSFVHREEDPRDYKVSFEKVRRELGYETQRTVADGIEELAAALDRRAFDDPFARVYSNT